MDVTSNTISMVERGHNTPSIKMLLKLADALSVAPGALLPGEAGAWSSASEAKPDPVDALRALWIEAHADSPLFLDVEAWARSLMERIEAEGPEAVREENGRLRAERDDLLGQTRLFVARLLGEVLGATRSTIPALKPRLDRVERELRSEIRRAYLRRLHLLMLVDDEAISQGVGYALMQILREAEKEATSVG